MDILVNAFLSILLFEGKKGFLEKRLYYMQHGRERMKRLEIYQNGTYPISGL